MAVFRIVLGLILPLLIGIAAAVVPDALARPTVATAQGPVRGHESEGVAVFHSIPFARPPVGDLRFRPPAYPAEAWPSVRDVVGLPNICPQVKVVGDLYLGAEDCLYLHVYVPGAPAPRPNAPRPVLFWIYGGGFIMGDGYELGLYDGRNLARATGAVVVAPNYRVGPFGFLAHAALQAEDPDRSTGNMGVRDQVAALRWVRDNIAAFGGDPHRVTIFGESAGAFSVCWHLVSPQSRGLFHAAALMSGSCDATQFFIPAANQTRFGDAYAARLGCNRTALGGDAAFLRCLRARPTAAVMKGVLDPLAPDWPGPTPGAPGLAPVMPWGPVIDGSPMGLAGLPLALLRRGAGNYVPTVFGSNKNEGSIFVPLSPMIVRGLRFPLTAAGARAVLRHFYRQNETLVELLLRVYPVGDYGNSNDRMVAAVLRDCLFACSMRRTARAVGRHGAPAWLYHFTYPLHFLEALVLGDYHTAFLPFLWGNPWPAVVHAFDAEDRALSATAQRFWAGLARHGDPNGPGPGGQGRWPRYNESTDLTLVMDVPLQVQWGLYREQCDFWDAQGGDA